MATESQAGKLVVAAERICATFRSGKTAWKQQTSFVSRSV